MTKKKATAFIGLITFNNKSDLSHKVRKIGCADNCYTAEFFDKNLIGEFDIPARSRATCIAGIVEAQHRFNMELDPRKFIWPPVYGFTHWLRPRNSPHSPASGLMYEGAIGQPRQTTSILTP